MKRLQGVQTTSLLPCLFLETLPVTFKNIVALDTAVNGFYSVEQRILLSCGLFNITMDSFGKVVEAQG